MKEEEREDGKTIVYEGPLVGLDKVVENCGCLVIIFLLLFGGSVYQLIKYAIDKFAGK